MFVVISIMKVRNGNHTPQSIVSRWNSFYCSGKKPYFSYRIRIETTKLNVPKLSNKQITLYQKICELRFDENLTWKQVAESLNGLGYPSSRGGINTSSTVCSTYFKIRKHFERQNIYHPSDLDNVQLVWI